MAADSPKLHSQVGGYQSSLIAFATKVGYIERTDRVERIQRSSIEDWEATKECINCYSGEKAKREIVVEKTITLTPTEFVAFCDNFLEDKDFIKVNSGLMKVDENGIWHCLKVTARGSKISVLVESEGYDYARYTAVIKK